MATSALVAGRRTFFATTRLRPSISAAPAEPSSSMTMLAPPSQCLPGNRPSRSGQGCTGCRPAIDAPMHLTAVIAKMDATTASPHRHTFISSGWPMPGDCKFHWEEEPRRRVLYQECQTCGLPKVLVKTLYALHPDGSKHPVPPGWVCWKCVEHAQTIRDRLTKRKLSTP